MLSLTKRAVHAVLLVALLGGCGQGPVLVVREANLETGNGVSLNGVSLNGVSLNGVSLNGSSLNGVSLNGTSLNGVSLNGALLNGRLSNGNTLPMRIDGVRQGTSPQTDVWFYKVSYQASDGWQPLCGAVNGVATEAIPLAGRWDYSQGTATGGAWIPDLLSITFGCVDRALGKCVQLGYKPWAFSGSTPLRGYHQACTRMLRADYCGDGRSFTVDGTAINLYDRLSLQTDTKSWRLEAEWKESGAQCLKSARDLRLKKLNISVPSCVSAKVTSVCGGFSSTDGSLLMTEFVQNYDD
jgi:ADYC domain/Pentapeptide repeats (8 copies)